MGFTEIYERIKLAANCRTQVELAELLNIRQSSISDAKRRDSVPGDWYMKLFERFGLNPDWLKYGVGPLYLRTEKGYCPQEAPQALAETVFAAQEWVESQDWSKSEEPSPVQVALKSLRER